MMAFLLAPTTPIYRLLDGFHEVCAAYEDACLDPA